MANSIEFILKLTERCNLNCSYCYYFNGSDKSFKEKPARLKANIIDGIISFLLQAINELNLDSVGIVFHGGESLLLNKGFFVEYCDKLKKYLEPKLKELTFSLQTNGMLIDEELIQIFQKYKINLGISMDGPKLYHDEYRITHAGKGSYEQVIKSINLLRKHDYDFGILSVIDPTKDPALIYNHFTKGLSINRLDFLWPDFTHNSPPPYPAQMYGDFITKILKIWISEDNSNIKIRFIDSYMRMFLGERGYIYGEGSNSLGTYPIFVIRSDGEITPSDELMCTDPDSVMRMNKSIFNTTLKEFFALSIFFEIQNAYSNSPKACSECCWETICAGGRASSRFSNKNRFDNPSVYCEGLKVFFSEIFKYLICSGVSKKDIAKNLCIKNY
ncbi:MAG: radical SAM protein [Rickettsiales bacterium]|nr:MAG: radical SAM protein [Rickettsiales bacterium]